MFERRITHQRGTDDFRVMDPPTGASHAADDSADLLGDASPSHLADRPPSLYKTVDAALASDEARAFHRRLAAALFLANACDAVEVLSIGFILTVYEKPSGEALSASEEEFLTAAVFCGMLLGGVVSGVLSDNIGRRKCLLASLAANTVAAFLSALSPDYEVLVMCRVVAGLGIGASVPSVFTLAAEMFPTSKRGEFITIVSSAWMFGSLFVAAVAWVVLGNDSSGARIVAAGSWRTFALLCALSPLTAWVSCFVISPESPRFLISSGRKAEAVAVLERTVLQGQATVRGTEGWYLARSPAPLPPSK